MIVHYPGVAPCPQYASICSSGGIGRRQGLKIPWAKARAGSSPAWSTIHTEGQRSGSAAVSKTVVAGFESQALRHKDAYSNLFKDHSVKMTHLKCASSLCLGSSARQQQGTENPRVGGSIPSLGTRPSRQIGNLRGRVPMYSNLPIASWWLRTNPRRGRQSTDAWIQRNYLCAEHKMYSRDREAICPIGLGVFVESREGY